MNKEKKEYPIWRARLSQKNIDWLKEERKKYNTYNQMINQLIKKYGTRRMDKKTKQTKGDGQHERSLPKNKARSSN